MSTLADVDCFLRRSRRSIPSPRGFLNDFLCVWGGVGYSDNFTFILQAACSSLESVLLSFYLQHFVFVIFWQKDISQKPDRKMLLKLTAGGYSGGYGYQE